MSPLWANLILGLCSRAHVPVERLRITFYLLCEPFLLYVASFDYESHYISHNQHHFLYNDIFSIFYFSF